MKLLHAIMILLSFSVAAGLAAAAPGSPQPSKETCLRLAAELEANLQIEIDQGGMRLTRRELMTRGATGAAAGLLLGRLAWAQAPEAAVHTLPAQVDAAREAPAVQIGLSRVVASPLGAYREAGANYNDRMAYLFEASAVGKLLRLTLSYPGDKPRLGELFLLVDSTLHWSLNALGTGYFTGLPHALTGGMIDLLFTLAGHELLSRLLW